MQINFIDIMIKRVHHNFYSTKKDEDRVWSPEKILKLFNIIFVTSLKLLIIKKHKKNYETMVKIRIAFHTNLTLFVNK